MLFRSLGAIYPFIRNPQELMLVGFVLMIPIYVLVAVLFAIYVPELFPTEVRLRASGICNTFGRGATIVTPFVAVALYQAYGIGGVLSVMIVCLLLQIVVVAFFGVEPRMRRLEELEDVSSEGVHPQGTTEALHAGTARDTVRRDQKYS